MSNTPGQVSLTHHNQHKSSTHQTHRRINTCTSTSLHTPTRQHTSTHQHISINTSNTINFTQHNCNNTIQCHQCINTSAHQHINTLVQQHISTSTHQHTTAVPEPIIHINTHQHNISTYQHINISTHWHINISTHQHINTRISSKISFSNTQKQTRVHWKFLKAKILRFFEKMKNYTHKVGVGHRRQWAAFPTPRVLEVCDKRL